MFRGGLSSWRARSTFVLTFAGASQRVGDGSDRLPSIIGSTAPANAGVDAAGQEVRAGQGSVFAFAKLSDLALNRAGITGVPAAAIGGAA